MKKTALIIILMCAAMLPACGPRTTELTERGIIGALGIDYENGFYEVSALFYNTDAASDTQSSFDVEYVAGQGHDVHSAFEDMRKATSKKLFFGHNTVLIIGRELAEKKIEETFSYIAQNREARLNISIFMAERTAGDIVKLNANDKALVGGSLEKLASDRPNGIDVKYQLFELLQKFEERGVCGVLPVVAVKRLEIKSDDSKGDEDIFDVTVDKLAVFYDSGMCGELSGDAMTGTLILQNRIDSIDIGAVTEGGCVYGTLIDTAANIDAAGQGDELRISINCRGSVSVAGYDRTGSEPDLHQIRHLFESEVCRLIDLAYFRITNYFKADLFDTEWYVSQRVSKKEAERYYAQGIIPLAQTDCILSITG